MLLIEYIEENWDTLLEELISWNYEMGSNLEEDLVSAFEAASAAAEQWGYNVEDIIAGISASMASIDSSYSSSSDSDSSTSSVVGKTNYDTTTTNESLVKAIVKQMEYYSALWNANNSAETNASYHEKVVDYAAQLAGYGVTASYDSHTGEWTITDDELNPSNVGKLLYNCYHSGGIVEGDNSAPGLKDNEVLAVLEEGEAVLDEQKKEALYDLIDFVTSLSDKLGEALTSTNMELISDGLRGNYASAQTGNISSVEPVTSNSVTFGDTYIYGSDGDTVDQHVEVNRKFVNTILKELNIR